MGYFIFVYTQTGLLTGRYPTLCIKIQNITKKPLNFYSLKVTKFHSDSVKNKSARPKQLEGGGHKPPPPACTSSVLIKETLKWLWYDRKDNSSLAFSTSNEDSLLLGINKFDFRLV